MMSIRKAVAASVVVVLAAGCNKAAPPAAPAAAPAAPAAAAAPASTEAAVLKVSKTVSIAAPAATVWAKVKDFDKLNGWHPAVAKDEIVEGKANDVGAVRLLTLGDGGTVKEKLTAFDDAAHSFGYTIVEGVLPVSAYTSTVTVATDGEAASTVTWSGEFKRAEGKDDKTATDTITTVYTTGLDNLKKVLETK
jgi:mxaD protein